MFRFSARDDIAGFISAQIGAQERMTDLGTTPRKYLTRTQRLRLFERHAGVCVLCGRQIRAGERWIAEHLRALGLAGTNDPDNLAPVHEACANVKNKDDWARITKAKSSKMASLGIKGPKQRIRSRGFAKKERAHADRVGLPPRNIYEDDV